jgi:hypothetical protein
MEGTEEKLMSLMYLTNYADYINLGSLHKNFIFGDSRQVGLYVMEVGESEESSIILSQIRRFFQG